MQEGEGRRPPVVEAVNGEKKGEEQPAEGRRSEGSHR